MKFIHRIAAWSTRRRLIRQRAENIRNLRAGREAAWHLKIRLAREIRLSLNAGEANRERTRQNYATSRPSSIRTAEPKSKCAISAIMSEMPKLERRAAA